MRQMFKSTTVDAKGNTVPAIGFSCGCTGTPEIMGNALRVLYNDGGNVSGKITKSITVYYKPPNEDVLVRVKNERGVEVFNPELSKTVLVFTATAV